MLKGTILDKTLDTVFENFKAGKKMAVIFCDGDDLRIKQIEDRVLRDIRTDLKNKHTVLLLLEEEGEDE